MTTSYEPHYRPPAALSDTPTITDLPRVPLYTEEFARDPHRIYREMRVRYGSLAPVELSPGIPATLVIGYQTAVRIANDPEHFSADPRGWERNIPLDCPVLPMMQWRPNALRSGGREHARYRRASVDGIEQIDQWTLHADIEQLAIPVINSFCEDGSADLLGQYALPVTFAYLNTMVGCPAEIGEQITQGMAMMFEGENAEEGNALFVHALSNLVALKREEPGEDLATRLVNHPAALSDEELVHQLVTAYGAGIEPLTNLIANTLLLMLTDSRYSMHAAAPSTTSDALNEVLYTDPPLANFGILYPKQPTQIDNVWLPAHQPVVMSMAACNNDPAVHGGEFTGNNAHLAWGSGPHACPAKSVAYEVAQHAINQLFDALPELVLACPPDQLVWRPGPFHRALATLPVVYPPTPPLSIP
ncbi:cytochrome P450 [Nocardia brevicatena]|uniref:cytochrome P450 n=1 Tax=Nocardia brevicatena TaxID=37327 RepID=UPI0002D8D5EF|nr:cytochrome P450 [Nocardia brevicatena]